MNAALPSAARWSGRRVFVTGHTGFVGGWLCAWLARLGAGVHGYSLAPPTTPSFFESTRLHARLAASTQGDIRDARALRSAVAEADPHVVFHLAAQPIVRAAHRDPLETYSTNVMGTVEVLEACRAARNLEKLVVYTTDKVYRNDQSGRAFVESDRLGGNEPYSASKAASDWTVAAYWESYFRGARVAASIVRAGNIIGGGDWAADRLLPDAARAFAAGKPLILRNPAATRPWQHVVDAVRGTLVLAERSDLGDVPADEIAWNFGPASSAEMSVGALADLAARAWGGAAAWRHEPDAAIPEARTLRLSSGKAERRLGWRCAWGVERAVAESVAWYRATGGTHGARGVKIVPLALAGTFEIQLDPHRDERGYFMRWYDREAFARAGLPTEWVQGNESASRRGVVRGLHFQRPPHAETKLVRAIVGRVQDVFVDLRRGSPTFGKWQAIELSDEAANAVLIPKGFAHGFCTLSDEAVVSYLVDSPYTPGAEGGLLWSDPALGIEWPFDGQALVSARDGAWPPLAGIEPIG